MTKQHATMKPRWRDMPDEPHDHNQLLEVELTDGFHSYDGPEWDWTLDRDALTINAPDNTLIVYPIHRVMAVQDNRDAELVRDPEAYAAQVEKEVARATRCAPVTTDEHSEEQ